MSYGDQQVTRVPQFQYTDTVCGPKLTDDCWYYIVGLLSSDPKALKNLLFVNKFLFHIAVPYLYNFASLSHPLPLEKRRNELRESYKEVMKRSIAVVSFLQARVMESKDTTKGNTNLSQLLDSILEKFNLSLIPSYHPSASVFLQKILDHEDSIKDSTEVSIVASLDCYGNEAKETPCVFHSTTIDYSKVFTYLQPCQIKSLKIFSLRSNILDHGDSRPVFQKYFDELSQAIGDMWLYYNHDHITELETDDITVHKFLPYTEKLPKLKILRLIINDDNSINTNPSRFKDAINFISKHCLAFPRKKALLVPGLHSLDHTINALKTFDFVGNDHESFTTSMKQLRRVLIKASEFVFSIYEALRQPLEVAVTDIPDFYNRVSNIQADQLMGICDYDHFRFEMGESESMGRFLRRCTNLRKLSLAASHGEVFSWATGDDEQQSGSQLSKLEELEIKWGFIFHAGVKVLNDGMKISSSTLKKASLKFDSSSTAFYLPNHAENTFTLRSLQLQRIQSANTIIDFSTPLPNLTHLEIELPPGSTIDFGALDNSPNLEILKIVTSRDIDVKRPEGDEPTSLPDSNYRLNLGWRLPKDTHDLFPHWCLPRLKKLIIISPSASRFRFASLPTMKSLEELTLKLPESVLFQEDEDFLKYLQLQCDSDQSHSASSGGINQYLGIFGLYSFHDWTIPNLVNVELSGVVAAAFCLEYIRSFPSLEVLTLRRQPYNPEELCRYPKQYLINLGSTSFDSSSLQFDDTPLLESKLNNLVLVGGWMISEESLISLLTVYAPYLSRFEARSLFCRGYDRNYSLFEAFNRADYINEKFRAKSPEKYRRVGTCLGNVICYDSLLTDHAIRKLGMLKMSLPNTRRFHRVYEFTHGTSQRLVRQSDQEKLDESDADANDEDSEDEDNEGSEDYGYDEESLDSEFFNIY